MRWDLDTVMWPRWGATPRVIISALIRCPFIYTPLASFPSIGIQVALHSP